MKVRNYFVGFIFLIALSLSVHGFLLAAVASPTVVLSGDDILQNGGTDDPYDALVVLDITTAQANPDIWEIQYSDDTGQTWTNLAANYESLATSHRKYYWSTSSIYAPTLLAKVRVQETGNPWSDYTQVSLSLAHRVTNHNAHYFVESFNTSQYQGTTTRINWDTTKALVELGPNPPSYHPNGTVTSLDLLSGPANNNVVKTTFQPVQWPFGKTLEYQLSNNGNSWYGDTSGNPAPNSWFSFPAQTLPQPVTVPFNGPAGNGLYFKIRLSTNDTSVTPQVFQLRFNWEENSPPQACFTVYPTGSDNPAELYSFNANCSSDYEDSLADLFFRWSADDGWSTNFVQGDYTENHNFNTTSTVVITLEVKDSGDVIGNFSQSINLPGVEGDVYGWLWSYNYGWTSLNCDNIYYGTTIKYCPPDYGWKMNANYTMEGWAWDSALGWLCLGSTCSPYGDPQEGVEPTAVYSRATGQLSGWGKYLVFGESGWLKLRDGSWCPNPEQDDSCVHVNLSNRAVEGWAWAGGIENGAEQGPGWVQFLGRLNVPWLETQYGSIYGRANVGSTDTVAAPSGQYNASYCILATGSIINLTSQNQECSVSSYRDLDFPKVNKKYKTISGIIDFETILNGEEENYITSDIDASLPQVLGGQVHYFSGQADYFIDQPMTFYNARSLNSSGAGTVVINGNLHINSNLYYENSRVSSQIENLASVAWIVKGDVIVDPSVASLVGSFIVLGQQGINCPTANCGHFKTGSDLADPLQLVVKGLIMAKQFTFERSYKKDAAAAEKIIYDGRVLVNTPPGLTDVAKGLPIWREAFATTEIE